MTESELEYSTYISFVNVIDMLNMRGYDISSLDWILTSVYGTAAPYQPLSYQVIDASKLVAEEDQPRVFKERATIPGKTLRQSLTRKFIHRTIPDKSIWVIFIEPTDDKGQISPAKIAEYILQYIAERNNAGTGPTPSYMFVSKIKLTTNSLMHINQLGGVEVWMEEELLINPYRHHLHPAVRPATMSELVQLKIDPKENPYKLSEHSKVKLWYTNDMAVRWMRYELGQVFFIRYKLPVAGKLVDEVGEFRLIVPPTGKEKTSTKKEKVETSTLR